MITKQLLIVAATAFLALSPSTSAAKTKFDKHDSIKLQNCTLKFAKDNADISLSYPQIASSAKQDFPLMNSLNRAVFKTLSAYPPYEYKGSVNSPATLELYCATIASGLSAYGKANVLEPIPFSFYSTWWAFGNIKVVTLFIEQYVFAGGAHGNTTGTFLNFDPITGEPIDLRQNIIDTAELLEIAAIQFCRDRHLPKDALKIRTGLFCDLSDLPMPKQLGFSDKGLVLFYNQYEIAPYVMGQISITIPYKYFKAILSEQFTVSAMRNGGGKTYNENMKVHKERGRAVRY